MTSKRTFERDFAAVTDAIAEDLDPEERTILCIEAISAGHPEYVDWLKETAPTGTYDLPDPDFIERLRAAQFMAINAGHALERGTWRFELARVRGLYYEEIASQYDATEEEFLEDLAMDDDGFEGEARIAATRFLVDYRAWTRFADEVLNVDLGTLLAMAVPDKWIDNIETMAGLATGQAFEYDVGGWATDRVTTHDGQERALDDAVDRKVTQLTAVWEEAQ